MRTTPRGATSDTGRATPGGASEVAGHARIGHQPDVRAYLTDAISSHGPERTCWRQREEETHMFTTDSFLGAEISYRQDRVRQDYGRRRWIRVRTDDTRK
ncbi:hypothetical protein GCM10009797_05180 [Nocardioides hwasunensis]